MPPAEPAAVASKPVEKDVPQVDPRPCVRCGALTDRVTFDPDSLKLDPAFCERCEGETWNSPVEYAVVEDL